VQAITIIAFGVTLGLSFMSSKPHAAAMSRTPQATSTDESVQVADDNHAAAERARSDSLVDDVQPASPLHQTVAFSALESAWLARQDSLSSVDNLELDRDTPAASSAVTVSYLDNSARAVDGLFVLAARGHVEALNAFVALGPGSPDYRERSLELLYVHAANGNVFALNTLAEWSASGFGFVATDVTSSIAFEYMAWLTGDWGSEDFAPNRKHTWSTQECLRGVTAARTFATGKLWAVRLSAGDPTLLCVARNG
jgi:hypothetical protein